MIATGFFLRLPLWPGSEAREKVPSTETQRDLFSLTFSLQKATKVDPTIEDSIELQEMGQWTNLFRVADKASLSIANAN